MSRVRHAVSERPDRWAVRPARTASTQARKQAREPAHGRGRDLVHHADGLPAAVPTGVVRREDAGVIAVGELVA